MRLFSASSVGDVPTVPLFPLLMVFVSRLKYVFAGPF
jgi:hypothetical protein